MCFLTFRLTLLQLILSIPITFLLELTSVSISRPMAARIGCHLVTDCRALLFSIWRCKTQIEFCAWPRMAAVYGKLQLARPLPRLRRLQLPPRPQHRLQRLFPRQYC